MGSERFQRLMSQNGVGLKQGSYNKIAHIPFFSGKWGEGGMINEMLLRRVLPAVAIYKGLKWADYHLGHKPSQILASIPLKARVLHAELTDRIPGARGLTNFYANVVPGGQFGALALPAGGAFLGGIFAYTKTLRGIPDADIAKVAAWKYAHLPESMHAIPGVKAVTRILHDLPLSVAIGAAIGGLLALPFLPGMLGDRKTADERRRIYSGEQLVPVSQGSFWQMGQPRSRATRSSTSDSHWLPP